MTSMTKEEHFSAGYVDGQRWAEMDAHSPGKRLDEMAVLREEATAAHYNRSLGPFQEKYAAYSLGLARGYRLVAMA